MITILTTGDSLTTGFDAYPNGYVIVDHKSYMGRLDTVQKHCIPFVSQLNVYADCLEKALCSKPLALLVHLPMIGLMVEIGRRASTFPGRDSE
ncbi:hypothetical protein [Desulfonatronum thioautotrophicum]|uniref:hypothetical protein n=1 Tax=Desulfonatronum thioautotrophicum TaxID=617001 RepID=UPI0005EB184C|nr:hypothetical protein [Desulfonatronum thioautotrophicum]